MYYFFGQSAIKHGYNVLVYEGPGQGSSLSEQGLTFTPEWHKPNSAVLDYFINRYGKPDKIAVIGMSLGAWLGMEAIGHDSRIDAYVANDVLYSFYEATKAQIPGILIWMVENKYHSLANFLAQQAAKGDLMIEWGMNQTKWTMGAKDAVGVVEAFKPYHFTDEMLSKVTADVLLMEGDADHLMKKTDQMGRTIRALKNARSVTRLSFKIGEGGEEHCHQGALLQAQAEMLKWIDSKVKM